QYTVTFDSNGGTEVAPITQDYASEITAPENPTRVGYEFAGWDKEIPATMPAEDMTITAQWTAKKFIYTFNKKDDKSNVASDVIEIEQTFDADVVMPTDEQLEWEGHTFEKYVETVPEKVTEDGEKTFTAQYSINTYKVTYYLNDEVVNVAEVKYGEAIPAYEPTVEEGMKFDGWQEEIPAVMPAYDLEIHGTTTATTAIKSIVAKFGESFDVYNVSGRLVQRVNGASDITRIPAGMYIINGTKVVIRKD
ncbi:MAG: InlB B-repeat-containing protein, partial [Prevotella sp.]|nr:InlB B-repeat-containing protein [Prevotella sp.]